MRSAFRQVATGQTSRTTVREYGAGRRVRCTTPELLRVSRLELRRLIRGLATQPHARRSIDPPAVVNEVARRLLGNSGLQELASRGDFYADMAGAFRRVLRDRAAAGLPDELSVRLEPCGTPCSPPIGPLDKAFTRLESQSPRHAQVAVLHLLGGMTHAEIAEQMGLSTRRVTVSWQTVREWLVRRLAQ